MSLLHYAELKYKSKEHVIMLQWGPLALCWIYKLVLGAYYQSFRGLLVLYCEEYDLAPGVPCT